MYRRLGMEIDTLVHDITEIRESLHENAYGEQSDLDALYHHLRKARTMTDYLVLRMAEAETNAVS